MAKLHEGLAIHKDRSAVAKKVIDEARGVFKSAAHFAGFVKRAVHYKEEDARFDATEEKRVSETVPGKLDYVNTHMRAMLDLDYQIERANSFAAGDLVVDDAIVVQAVPVGFLLTIEAKFKEYRAMLEMIPTHAPGIEWVVDPGQSSKGDILRSKNDQRSFITKKTPVYNVVVPATPEHPAQVKESHDDVRIAEVVTTVYTSTISPAQKSDMLGRCDAVIRAAKRARQRANDTDIGEDRIASPLLDYIVHGETLRTTSS